MWHRGQRQRSVVGTGDGAPVLVITDLKMDEMDGMALLDAFAATTDVAR
ncbi:hypothetical protein GGI1_09233, partial [Acidithiobacillus sp. GGI-221]